MAGKFRMGMVGGGVGGFIGAVHRQAALLDGDTELVSGAFSSDPARARESASLYFVDPGRCHTDWKIMASAEAALPPDERIDFVSVVVPNNLHLPVTRAFADVGIPVFCEKPMARTVEEALDMKKAVEAAGVEFGLAHVYSGFPMIREARARVAAGELGDVRHIFVSYTHGNMLDVLAGRRKANWRAEPTVSGPSNVLADIGTHAVHLGAFVTGLWPTELFADLSRLVEGQPENEASTLLRYADGVRGLVRVSQISAGDRNKLSLRVTGSKASLEWHLETPEQLWIHSQIDTTRLLRRGESNLAHDGARHSRLPAGHPEGFIEAFAAVYQSFKSALSGQEHPFLPTLTDGLQGLRFVEAALASAKEEKWTKLQSL